MSVTEQDRERARKAIGCDCADRAADDASPSAGVSWHFGWCAGDCCDLDAIAQAFAEGRERARAPFLALAEELEREGEFSGPAKGAAYRIAAYRIRHTAEENAQ